MQTIADGVIRVSLAPRAALNVYLIDEHILVDTGMPHQRKRLLRLLRDQEIDRIVLTHAHVDHAGTVAGVSAEKGAEVLCGAADLADLAAGVSPPIKLGRAMIPVQRALVRYRGIRASPLQDGDDVGGGFVAIQTRGHSPGHHSLWRERDGILIAGDALIGVSTRLHTGVFRPAAALRPDDESVTRSIVRLAELRPKVIAFGHGPPLIQDAAHQLSALAKIIR